MKIQKNGIFILPIVMLTLLSCNGMGGSNNQPDDSSRSQSTQRTSGWGGGSQPQPRPSTKCCTSDSICREIFRGHRIDSASKFNSMRTAYFNTLNLEVDNYKSISVNFIDSMLHSKTDICSYRIKLAPDDLKDTTDNEKIELKLEEIPASLRSIPSYYNIALFQKIIESFGIDSIRDFQFSYGIDLQKKRSTIVFRVRRRDDSDPSLYLGDYSDEPPTKKLPVK